MGNCNLAIPLLFFTEKRTRIVRSVLSLIEFSNQGDKLDKILALQSQSVSNDLSVTLSVTIFLFVMSSYAQFNIDKDA